METWRSWSGAYFESDKSFVEKSCIVLHDVACDSKGYCSYIVVMVCDGQRLSRQCLSEMGHLVSVGGWASWPFHNNVCVLQC